jgi:hypothetical protein
MVVDTFGGVGLGMLVLVIALGVKIGGEFAGWFPAELCVVAAKLVVAVVMIAHKGFFVVIVAHGGVFRVV